MTQMSVQDSGKQGLRGGYGRNSFAWSGAGWSFWQLLKLLRYILTAPLLLAMQLLIHLWPLTSLWLAVSCGFSLWSMKDGVNAGNVIGALVNLYFLRFFLTLPKEVRKAIWAHSIDKFVVCRKPGVAFRVVRTSEDSSDIVVDPSFIRSRNGKKVLTLVGSPYQFRRCLDVTLTEVLAQEGYGCETDDIDAPQYFLHGTGADSIAGMDEVWTTHSSIASWAAWYSFPEAVPHFSFSIPLEESTTVVGYVHLLKTDAPLSKEQVSTLCCPLASFVPPCMGQRKAVARRSYWAKFLFGNFPACKPDAYIFRAGVIEETGLRTSHRFRIVAQHEGAEAV
jgi:hypothetical protein